MKQRGDYATFKFQPLPRQHPGFLVKDNLLRFDTPIRDAVPSLRFFNDTLDQTVTLRDMLAHRTGITRHDNIWYRSEFTRRELFERIKFLAPVEPIRSKFIYNNMMYAAAGYAFELLTGKTWEDLVRDKLLRPLEMHSTCFTIGEMLTRPDYAVPYSQKRDTNEIYAIPYYEEIEGIAPAGAIISNIEEMSHWLVAIMNEGNFLGNEIVPANILKETMTPAIPLANSLGETWGFWERFNEVYGMGRITASYRGHLLTLHGGGIDGFVSQVSFMPQHKIGVIAFSIGDHCGPLADSISHNIYERYLGLDRTPWSERWLGIVQKSRQADKNARSKAGADRVADTAPSHSLGDYAGNYEHHAYGDLNIALGENHLIFIFRKASLPLSHFHYDRFDTPEDERHGKHSVNFGVNPQGDIDRAIMSLDEAEVVFLRRPDCPSEEFLQKLVGTYESLDGFKIEIIRDADGSVRRVSVGAPDQRLTPYRGLKFRVANFSDRLCAFVESAGKIIALKETSPSGEFVFEKK